MRWLDGITNSTGMSLSKLQEMVRHRGPWRAIVPGVAKGGIRLTEQHHIQPRRAEATAETHMCLVPVLNNHTMATIM